MSLEVAILNVRAGESAEFEQAFAEAQAIIASMPGYVAHQLSLLKNTLEIASGASSGHVTISERSVRQLPHWQCKILDPLKPASRVLHR